MRFARSPYCLRWCRCLSASALAVALSTAPVSVAQRQAEEYRLKAAFVFRFPQFIEWPATAVAGRNAVEFCVVRPDPFGAILPDLLKGEAIDERPLRLRAIAPRDPVDTCHVVVIAGTAASRSRTALLKRVSGRPVLTIGDHAEFLSDGGIIVMKVVENRVRFEVSLTNARRSGLEVSSQLLRLAVAVHGGQP